MFHAFVDLPKLTTGKEWAKYPAVAGYFFVL